MLFIRIKKIIIFQNLVYLFILCLGFPEKSGMLTISNFGKSDYLSTMKKQPHLTERTPDAAPLVNESYPLQYISTHFSVS